MGGVNKSENSSRIQQLLFYVYVYEFKFIDKCLIINNMPPEAVILVVKTCLQKFSLNILLEGFNMFYKHKHKQSMYMLKKGPTLGLSKTRTFSALK